MFSAITRRFRSNKFFALGLPMLVSSPTVCSGRPFVRFVYAGCFFLGGPIPIVWPSLRVDESGDISAAPSPLQLQGCAHHRARAHCSTRFAVCSGLPYVRFVGAGGFVRLDQSCGLISESMRLATVQLPPAPCNCMAVRTTLHCTRILAQLCAVLSHVRSLAN